MSDDTVNDDEIVYRRISAGRNFYKRKSDGTIEVSSMAFSDRECRISVDRAKLCKNDPHYTLGGDKGGVIAFSAKEIRNINDITRNDPKGTPIQKFEIEVEPVPTPENNAHAEIYAIPMFTDVDKSGAFRRLCRSLARLATLEHWKILPTDLE